MIIDLNSPWIDPNVYSGLAAFTVQPYSEINSKQGTQWETQVLLTDLEKDTPQYFSFTTGSQPVLIKRRTLAAEFSRISYKIFRNSTVSGGTPLELGNLSDVQPQTGEVDGRNQPSVVDLGDPWAPPYIFLGTGENKTITFYGGTQGERVLKPNTTYIVEITNLATVTIPYLTVDLTYYEGPLDVEIRATDLVSP